MKYTQTNRFVGIDNCSHISLNTMLQSFVFVLNSFSYFNEIHVSCSAPDLRATDNMKIAIYYSPVFNSSTPYLTNTSFKSCTKRTSVKKLTLVSNCEAEFITFRLGENNTTKEGAKTKKTALYFLVCSTTQSHISQIRSIVRLFVRPKNYVTLIHLFLINTLGIRRGIKIY